MEIKNISGINGLPLKIDNEESIKTSKKNFSDILKEFIADVNNDLITAKDAEKALAMGETNDIQQVMYLIEKADISFRLITEIRNKALEAYQEIMRMQV
ncbi:flagellar hook-basal body complex protein FliE [Venenivibrio stagnispumantis]|uniref:Flagellar hook-basal body complex protein FliE n=1 Tax=Venenivibrio stagnispumantis TaxID=407998 RepID=A0AA45WIK9_9AQUI|nr:flagellar hook-basal body complex protein FliE [Venenivibrio stagnispumantis]MCW4572629.1 flagellar hook-basal body complex protein FliE [Venenivibrio stagnispumantis]SMP00672.1 flagellar hook-basal body complex protein FliE [Venenivibrio stagnispumantis]